MKSYSHVISKVFNEPALITPQRHAALCMLLDTRLASLPAAALNASESATSNLPPATATEGEQCLSPRAQRQQYTLAEMYETRGSTAIIRVCGTIVAHPEDIAMSECGVATEDISAAISRAEADDTVNRLLFQFDSPGGTVTGVPECGNRILACRKETVAFTDSECCSGALWLAAQCQTFLATPSSRVGSVGVYNLTLDMSKSLAKDGVKVNAISAGKYKLLGAYWKPLSDDEKGLLQARVDKIYGQFKQAMESHRVVNDENFGNGLVFDGDEAAQIGFTNGVVESLEDLLTIGDGEED